ncbi:MAG: TolC family outer membrane protein [Gammaproteobacteria bacterium]|nr:TolC family outer membrane protein [Gammaproteobacteria bacterium]
MMKRFRFALASILLVAGGAQAEDLQEILELALANDPQLKAAESALMADEELKRQARAVLFPTIDLSADTTFNRLHTESSFFNTIPGSSKLQRFNSNGYTLKLSQPVFNNTLLVGLKQVNSVIAKARAEYLFAQQDLVLRSASAYFDVLGAMDTLRFAQAEKAAISRQLEQAQKRFDVGLIAITDIHEAQARYDLSVADELLAINGLEQAWEGLREITGQSHAEVAGLMDDTPLMSPEPAVIEEWVNLALESNLQVEAQKQAVETSRQDIALRKSGHYPTLDIEASYTDRSDNASRFGSSSETEDQIIGLRFNLPLFQGGFVNSRTREAALRHRQAKDLLEQQRRSAERQTRQAYLQVESTVSRVKALRQALVSTQSALEATELGFEVGTRTAVDVLDSQRELYRARRELALARYDHLVSTLQLKLAAGQLGGSDVGQINGWLVAGTP